MQDFSWDKPEIISRRSAAAAAGIFGEGIPVRETPQSFIPSKTLLNVNEDPFIRVKSCQNKQNSDRKVMTIRFSKSPETNNRPCQKSYPEMKFN